MILGIFPISQPLRWWFWSSNSEIVVFVRTTAATLKAPWIWGWIEGIKKHARITSICNIGDKPCRQSKLGMQHHHLSCIYREASHVWLLKEWISQLKWVEALRPSCFSLFQIQSLITELDLVVWALLAGKGMIFYWHTLKSRHRMCGAQWQLGKERDRVRVPGTARCRAPRIVQIRFGLAQDRYSWTQETDRSRWFMSDP